MTTYRATTHGPWDVDSTAGDTVIADGHLLNGNPQYGSPTVDGVTYTNPRRPHRRHFGMVSAYDYAATSRAQNATTTSGSDR